MGEYVVNRPDERAMDAALRWEQVEKDRIRLEDREVPLTKEIKRILDGLAAEKGREGYVLAVPRSGRPYERTRLSRLTRAAPLGTGAGQRRPLLRRMIESGKILQRRQRYLLADSGWNASRPIPGLMWDRLAPTRILEGAAGTTSGGPQS